MGYTALGPRVFKYDTNGNFITVWGGASVLGGGAAGIAISSEGRFYLSANTDNKVHIFTTNGQFIADLNVNSPNGIAIDNANNVYVVDPFTPTIHKFDKNGNPLPWVGDEPLESPVFIATDSNNNVYVTDNGITTHCVMEYDSGGNFIRKIGSGIFTNFLAGITIDSQNNIYVADVIINIPPSGVILKFNSQGTKIDTITGTSMGLFELPIALTTDKSSTLFVGDAFAANISKFNFNDAFLGLFPTTSMAAIAWSTQ